MINQIKLDNFGPLSGINWSALGKINLVIGGNGSGKTFLLKAIYSSLRTLEEYKRGNEQRSAAEILADKLYWTFQAEKIGDLVSKGADAPLSSALTIDNKDFSYSFGKDTSKQISNLENHVPPRASNSVFLPAKEVLSLHQIILKSREQDKVFGFDDTYYDLAKALRISTSRGRNYEEFAKSRRQLEGILGGVIEFDEASGNWLFAKGRHKFPIGVTAEGIKKIAILDTLLGNRYLDTNSVVLIDEPESALHPTAISQLLDIVAMLAERGIQFFMASHSYFVVKKLFLMAQERGWSIPVISATDSGWVCD
ncbi:MAG: AAA family ATPase, partial [Polaromonas sp.]